MHYTFRSTSTKQIKLTSIIQIYEPFLANGFAFGSFRARFDGGFSIFSVSTFAAAAFARVAITKWMKNKYNLVKIGLHRRMTCVRDVINRYSTNRRNVEFFFLFFFTRKKGERNKQPIELQSLEREECEFETQMNRTKIKFPKILPFLAIFAAICVSLLLTPLCSSFFRKKILLQHNFTII